MPKELEEKLKKEYRAKGLSGERLNHAVYGTMNKLGAMHGNKETAKGKAMEAKHESHKPHNPPYPGVPGAPVIHTNPQIAHELVHIPGMSAHEIVRTEAANSQIITPRGDSSLEFESEQPQSQKNFHQTEYQEEETGADQD